MFGRIRSGGLGVNTGSGAISSEDHGVGGGSSGGRGSCDRGVVAGCKVCGSLVCEDFTLAGSGWASSVSHTGAVDAVAINSTADRVSA